MARRSSNFAKHHFYIDALYTSTSQTIRGEGPVVAFCFVLPVSNLSQTSTFVKHNKDELVGKKKKRCTLVSGIVSWSLPSPHNLSLLLPCQPVLTSYMSGIGLGFGNEGLNRKKERQTSPRFLLDSSVINLLGLSAHPVTDWEWNSSQTSTQSQPTPWAALL